MQVLPRVPLRADKLPRDSVADLRGKVDRQTGGSLERRTAGISLLDSFVEIFLSDGVRACAQDFSEQPGVQGSRRDRIDIDGVSAQLFGQSFGQPDHGCLRRCVGAESGERRGRTAAGEIDDFSAASTFHVPDAVLTRKKNAIKIDLDRSSPFDKRNGFARSFWPVDARVVHQDLNRAQMSGDIRKQTVHLIGGRDIAGGSKNLLTLDCLSAKFLGNQFDQFAVPGTDRNISAFFDKCRSDCFA